MWNLSSKKLAAAVLAATLGAGSVGPAAGGPATGGPAAYDRAGGAGSPVFDPTPAAGTNDDGFLVVNGRNLPAFLQSLNYTVSKTAAGESGGNICTISFDDGSWSYVVEVSVSGDNSVMWLACVLDQVPDHAPASAILNLLEKNDTIGPAAFSWSRSSNHLLLNFPIDNSSMTAARFRSQLSRLQGIAKQTHPAWDMSRFTARNDAASNNGAAANNAAAANNGAALNNNDGVAQYRFGN